MHCGGPGAGHFVKMVHNGIEYGIMQAYAEGFNILHEANAGSKYVKEGDAEVAPMSNPESYCYDIDVAKVAEVAKRTEEKNKELYVVPYVVGRFLNDLHSNYPVVYEAASRVRPSPCASDVGRWTLTTF